MHKTLSKYYSFSNIQNNKANLENKMTSGKRIAIIGSGASGIAAIKCCLDEGLVPVCFERTDHIGK